MRKATSQDGSSSHCSIHLPDGVLRWIYVANRNWIPSFLAFWAHRFLLLWITPSPAFFGSPLMTPSASLMLPLVTLGVAIPCVVVGLVLPSTSMFLGAIGFINYLVRGWMPGGPNGAGTISTNISSACDYCSFMPNVDAMMRRQCGRAALQVNILPH
jgi:hypothetical protein